MTWSAPLWRPALVALVGVAVLALAPGGTAPVPQAVAVVLLLLAAYDALARPALAADERALRWRAGLVMRSAAWDEVDAVRAVTGRRGLVTLDGIELDVRSPGEDDPDLVVLPRWRLGEDPEQVLAALEDLRPAR